MKSIRFTLLFYFLVLLVLALAAVSTLLYRTAENSLALRQQSIEDLEQTKYNERCTSEAKKLDEALLRDAHALAGFVQLQLQPTAPSAQSLYLLGLLSALPSSNGHCTAPLWLYEGVEPTPAEGQKTSFFKRISWMGSTLDFKKLVLPHPDEEQGAGYFQLNNLKGSERHSDNLRANTFAYRDFLKNAQPYESKFDDTKVNGKPVRRVAFKVTDVQRTFAPPPRPMPPGRPRPKQFGPGERPTVAFLVQVARETGSRDAAVTRYKADLDAALDERKQKSEAELHALGRDLLIVSLLTFAVTVVGGFWLVGAGLAPLQRLSEAVSRVSAKDFRLPLDSRPLPAELKPIVARLTETLELLQRAFAREKQAAADISHELRTPLAALLTTLDVALRKPRPAEDYRQLLEDCRASGLQMSQLVERMLALARLDAGSDHMRPREVDASVLAEQCAAVVRPLAEARGLQLHVRHSGPALLTADPDKLREVLTNLLHNAIEYNRDDGRVELAVERDNGQLRLQVSDTGVGIAPEACEHVFERFYRADPSRQSETMHAGIGLAIVKGYIDLMGGTIELDSTVGKGSTFTVSLPASPKAKS